MDVHRDMFPAHQVNQNNEDDSNGAIEYNNHTNRGNKRHKQVTYKDMMNGVNELVHTVQDSDELVKSMLMSFDEYIRKIFYDKYFGVIVNSTLDKNEIHIVQRSSFTLPLKLVTKGPHPSRHNQSR